ncbi:MAG: TPM domain-containing protein [Bacteroidota bacterium]|nr:TPM domain-containing protein [Bacteroidota bacterium]
MFNKKFFSEQEEQVIIKSITEAETKTSGEIKVHVDSFCFGNAFEKAKKVFLKLNMQNTKYRNGVLIYIATSSKKIAIIGDEGINSKVPTNFWDEIINDLGSNFRTQKANVLSKNIIKCGEQLSTFFPLEDGDTNELSNSISY